MGEVLVEAKHRGRWIPWATASNQDEARRIAHRDALVYPGYTFRYPDQDEVLRATYHQETETIWVECYK